MELYVSYKNYDKFLIAYVMLLFFLVLSKYYRCYNYKYNVYTLHYDCDDKIILS